MRKICSVVDCSSYCHGNGLCNKHWIRSRKNQDLLKEPVDFHGMSHTREHNTWAMMKNRCYNPNYKGFNRYGGRGIVVCKRWLNSFSDFYTDMGDKPENMTLERIDNNKGYSPDNCKWATYTEQNNNRSNNLTKELIHG